MNNSSNIIQSYKKINLYDLLIFSQAWEGQESDLNKV